MKKINFLTLLFAALLVSGNVWGADDVCQIGSTKYSNLNAAASAVQVGETITILKSYVEQQNVTFNKACVVDLNGKQIEIYSWYAKSSDVDKSSKYFKVNADVEFKNGSLYAEGTTNGTGILYQYGNTTMTLTNVNILSKHNNGCAIKFEDSNSQTLIINAGTTIKSDGLADIMKNTNKNNKTNDVSATIINNANLKSINIIDYNYDENYTKFVTFNVTNNAQIGKLAGYAKYFNLTNAAGASATLNITNYCHFSLNNAGTLTFAQGFFGSENTTETITNTGTIAITGGRYLQTWYTSQNLDDFVDSNSCQKYADKTAGGLDVFRILKSADARAKIGEAYYPSVFEAMSFVPLGHEVTTVIEVLKDDTIPGRPSSSLCFNKEIQINMNGKKLVFSGPTYGLWMEWTGLDFEGEGELVMLGTENYESMFYMIGNYLSEKAQGNPIDHLTIGKDIVVNVYGDATKVASDEQYFTTLYYFGQQVDIHGTINCIRGLGNWYTGQGKIAMSTDYVPVVNIDGQLIAEQTAIFSENNVVVNISGDAVISGGHSGIESIAGVFNVTGGTIESTYSRSEQETKESVHGNTTTVGAGIVLYPDPAFADETAVVNLNAAAGKTVLVNGQIPVKVANPNNVATSSIGEMININVEMAKLKATNGQSVVAWAACDDAIAISGGKFSHVPSYVVPGKTVISTPEADPDHVVYPYMIGVVKEDAIVPVDGRANITWEVNADWQNENVPEEHKIPTSQDSVKIANNQIVTVTGKTGGTGSATEGAYAYSIDIADGGQIIVKSGARLAVGKGGINEANKTNQSVIVEDGGELLIEPTADVAEEVGTVKYIAKTFKRHDDWEEFYDHGYQLDMFGNPIEGETTISANPTGYNVWLNTWDPNAGWEVSNLAAFKESTFTGFMFWNNRDVDSSRVEYSFSGKLVGNKVNHMQFAQDGYKCFANSYTAPIDVKALLRDLEGDIQRAVYIYLPEDERFEDINNAKLQVSSFEYREIAPMQGFFVRNMEDEEATAPIDYLSMVWTPAFEKQSNVDAAPARKSTETDNTQVRIQLTDNTANRTDYVFLVEGEQFSAERDASDIEKMMNGMKSVNIYASTEIGNLSTMQTDNLDGQALTITTNPAISYTMTFDWVGGDDLYLYDATQDVYTLMSSDNSYTFVANPSTTIADRFSVVKQSRGIVTELQQVEAPISSAKGVYTITGQKVGDVANWFALPKGVYIVNGQKIVK